MVYFIGMAAIASTLLGGLLSIRLRDKLHLILGFSAGAVMGVALFDLLPESFELASGQYEFKAISFLIMLGFIAYMLLDRFLTLHTNIECNHDQTNCSNPNHRGKLGASTLAFHSFLDGIGIGLAFKVSPSIGWVVTAAVLAHDFSDGINTVNMILRNKGAIKESLKWLVLDALAPVLGIIATYFFSVSEAQLGLILAVFTGLFLYIGASDLIPESHHHHPVIWTTLMTTFGIIVIYATIQLAG